MYDSIGETRLQFGVNRVRRACQAGSLVVYVAHGRLIFGDLLAMRVLILVHYANFGIVVGFYCQLFFIIR